MNNICFSWNTWRRNGRSLNGGEYLEIVENVIDPLIAKPGPRKSNVRRIPIIV